MNAALDASSPSARPSAALVSAIARACHKIAPLWPLKHFVAVNPFLGFSGESFAATCETLRRVAQVNALMPRAFYVKALVDGWIEDCDLEAALLTSPTGRAASENAQALRLAAHEPEIARTANRVVATVADVLDALAAGDRQLSRTAFMIDEISKWCAAYFDEGQAAWRLPTRTLRPYAAWRATARFDRTPETLGIRRFRQTICALPENPVTTIGVVVSALKIPDSALEDYLHRALFDIQGWAAYARYRVWDNALYGRSDDTLVELLAIRIAWGYALFRERTDPLFKKAWDVAMAEAAFLPQEHGRGEDPELRTDLLLHEAYEAAYQRRLLAQLSAASASPNPRIIPIRKPLQAAFCIDVRSEVYRRALEIACPAAETIGFAGFFGFPIEYVPIGRLSGGAQCPVLLKPAFVVCEEVAGASEKEETEILALRLMRRRAVKAWKAFKLSAVSSFTYVETLGLLFAAKILGDSWGLTRTVQDPNIDGLSHRVIGRVGPRLAPRIVGGRMTGFQSEQRIAMAEAVLRAMSMTQNFARLVLLAGHGSTTANNPHASALDCGACGGHSGEANARVAAQILNDPLARTGLKARGIVIPEDTWFLSALHDTTTDGIRLYDLEILPDSHQKDLVRLKAWLAKASSLSRLERSARLRLDSPRNVDRQVISRSRDWSQVRPEWGLAGNAAFIAAPRERTRRVDLKGRAFLHTYDWHKDTEFTVLELIMTAPMVVASWINLQYYGSTVNNRAFGSGNKTLHNVVGQLGVLEGNAGDLKVGLPWQAVHDGYRLMHQPLRLNVLIEAPEAEINRVIAKHLSVRELVDNAWVHLFVLVDEGRTIRRYLGGLRWGSAQ